MRAWWLVLAACKSAPVDDTEVSDTDVTDTDVDTDDGRPEGWLFVEDGRILHSDGRAFHGRGADVQDTRGCGACLWEAPSPSEVTRRIDLLTDTWGANFLRLTLESYPSATDEWQVNWASIDDDPAYLADIVEIIDHVAAKPDTYALVSLWVDPGHSDQGWPTAATQATWKTLAEAFVDQPRVMFGVVNEPQSNFDGALDADVWTAMNDVVQAIRDVEDAHGAPHHLIAVQGTGAWARYLDYYVDHPITAGGGDNVVYEVHVYDPVDTFDDRFVGPSATLPVIIGEFGPADGYMSMDDAGALMDEAEATGVPWLAWTLHMRCPPSLLVDHSGGGCGVGMDLEPTPWGELVRDRLETPW